jgi:predicted ester cyclase
MDRLEQNKATVRAYADAFSRGDFDAVTACFTPDATIQGVLGQGGLEFALGVWRELHAAYGLQLRIEALAAEGEWVAARYLESGTFRAPFRGQAPTGKSFSLVAMEWFRMRDGKIAERWGARDSAAMNRQMGLD